MKAFLLNKLKLGSQKDKEKDKDKDGPREKVPQLGPLPEWPPAPLITATPSSVKSFKPLPELSSRQLPPIEHPPPEPAESSHTASSSSTPTQPNHPPLPASKPTEFDAVPSTRTPVAHPPEPITRSVSKATTNTTATINTTTAIAVDVNKKVAFISPSTTPTAERPLRSPTPAGDLPPPMKKVPSNRPGRPSTSGPASSRTDLSIKSGKLAAVRGTTSPNLNKGFADNASIQQTIRSNTPYSQSNSSRIMSPASWSELTEVDLVANLGSRERTRQEVLYEIVSSEERYVNELARMKETFIDPLLHPFSATSASPQPTTPHPGTSIGDFRDYDEYLRARPSESLERLPIASRFLSSPVPGQSTTPAPQSTRREETPHPEISDDDVDDDLAKGFSSKQNAKLNHPRSPYNTVANRSGRNGEVPFPSRSHQSLPPPPRGPNPTDSTHSLGRQSAIGDSGVSTKGTIQTQGTRLLRKTQKGSISEPVSVPGAIPPRQLPEDLRICLEVIENDLLEGHVRLSEALKKRYEEQYPLVRSLADVFVSSSHILTGYAKYVLHLEKALEQVDNAVKYANSAGRKSSKKQESDQLLKVGTYLQRLEENAAEKGETGLAISLSKPFQRLLKYPLMFQNLLFHTDPSTFEYESTLQMVAEVETIVRSIEDEKILKEERDKTRDVLGRIDGLDKVKQLAVPKPSRVLVEERMVIQTGPSGSGSPPPGANGGKVKGKPSFKRLSDVLQPGSGGIGGKKDLWLVVFNDVVLRCQRTGTTSLPIGGAPYGRTNSMPEMQGKSKFATTGRRNTQAKPRNLYKFLRIETWDIGNVVKPREGVVAMDEVVRSRALHASVQPRIMPLPDDDEDDEAGDSDDSDRKSKMSFSYWGADKITLQKPVTSKPRQVVPTQNGVRRGPTSGITTYNRESSANAKFGTRLLSAEPIAARPSSRRNGAVTPVRRPPIDDTTVVKATITRPAWNENPRSTSTPTPIPKRQRNTSRPNAVVATRTPNNNSTTKLSSPSEDSGVGMYRQVLANDPSLAS